MDNNTSMTEEAPSKLKNFVSHPVTREVARFAGYLLVTFGGRWLLGKAAAVYRDKKAAQLQPAQQQHGQSQPARHPASVQASSAS